MAGNSPSQQPPPPSPPLAASNNQDPIRYWCYHCNKRVPVETLPDHPDVICFECKNGFVESISVSSHARQVSGEETPAFGNEFVQILRLIARAAREDDEPPPPPSDRPAGDNDYLRIELDGWNDGSYIVTDEEDQEYRDQVRARWYYEDDDDDDDDEHEEQIENGNEEDIENRIDEQIENRIEEDIENRDEEQIENRIEEEVEDEHDEDFDRRNRREIFRRRLREVAGRAASRHNRIMDWAEMLIGLEDQSIEFRLQVPGYDDDDDDAYVGNPGDYVDAAGYDALLQHLAETDSSGKRGAPPASKSAVENLQTVEVKSTDIEICAVCKDRVFNIGGKIVKQLECGHMYHGECIIPWLDSRNTCPVCRFELPTDDPEYEEDRKRRLVATAAAATNPIDHGCSSSSGAGG